MQNLDIALVCARWARSIWSDGVWSETGFLCFNFFTRARFFFFSHFYIDLICRSSSNNPLRPAFPSTENVERFTVANWTRRTMENWRKSSRQSSRASWSNKVWLNILSISLTYSSVHNLDHHQNVCNHTRTYTHSSRQIEWNDSACALTMMIWW